MFNALDKIGMKYRERVVIYNLFSNQVAVIEVEQEATATNIRKGVRKKCTFSSIIFNLCIEEVLRELEQGQTISTYLCFVLLATEDTAIILALNKGELQMTFGEMEEVLTDNYSVTINKNKTKVLVCSRRKNKRRIDIAEY